MEELFKGKQISKDIQIKDKWKSVKLWTVEKIEVEKYTPKRIEKKAAPFE